MRGHVDRCTPFDISGWAISDGPLSAELTVEADSRVVCNIRADQPRKDLHSNCGFRHKFEPSLRDAKQIRIYFTETKVDLAQSPYDLLYRLENPTDKETTWSREVQLPPVDQMKLIGSNSKEIFVNQGTRMAKVLSQCLSEYFGSLPKNARVLDFGCGVGRVLLPLSAQLNAHWYACDVNNEAIKFLREAVPNIDSRVTGYDPPLPFNDDFFDCTYSISIWTHLPIEKQIHWLKEVKRIVRPGGLVLISTSGAHVVDVRRTRGDIGWTELTAKDLDKAGVLFRPYTYGGLAGIDGAYGLAAHHPRFIERVWSQIMPLLTTRERAIEAMQDIHIMTKL